MDGGQNSTLYKNKRKEASSENANKGTYSLEKYNTYPQGYNERNLLYGVTDIQSEKRMMGISTDLAQEFISEALNSEEPWCCFVSICEPHDPFICGQEAFSRYDIDSLELPPNVFDTLEGRPNIYKKASFVWETLTEREKKEAMVCYFASVTEIDAQFGRMIEMVKDSVQSENTIIILTTDHGELLGAHGLYCKNISAYEEVYNIPLIISGPGIRKGDVSNARVGLHDLCQTLLELTGCQTFDVPDSRSFIEVLHNSEKEKEFTTGFAEYFGGRILLTQRVVWEGPWKFVFNGFDFDELYHLDEDPYEMDNLAGKPEYQDVVYRMCAKMWKVIKDTNDHSLYQSDYPILRLAPYGPGIISEGEH